MKFGFDILILSETWLSANIPDRLLSVNGYKIARNDRQRGRLATGHGGVAVLVRESFETEILKTPVTDVPNSNLEVLWVTIRVGNNRRLLVGSTYRVPINTMQQVAADLDDLELQMQHMIAMYPHLTIVIGGDMNCCLLKPGANTPGDRLTGLLTQHGLQTCNSRQPTYRPAGSLLDILATNRGDLVTRAGVTRCHYGTPHDFTRLALRLTGSRRSPGAVTRCRSLARVDTGAFNHQLLNADWGPVYTATGPEAKWAAFAGTFKPLLDSAAPVRQVRLRPPGAPPTSPHTRHLLGLRRTALSAGRRQDYKELNRLSRAAIRADCRRHLQERLAQARPGGMWRVLKPIIGSKKASSPITGVTAEALNNYYVSVAPQLAATVPAPTAPVPIRLPRVNTGGLKIKPISMETLWVIVRGMTSSSFESSDGLSSKTIHTYFTGFGHILLDIVNASLESGRVPAAWKHAIITPIPKGKSAVSDPARTRPISMLPAITKIAERAVQLQITDYMESHHLLSDAQHGYRKNYSSETALHVVTDDILRAMDCGEITLWAMVDLSKCFDMVPHDRLIQKLALYGIDHFWISDYLNGHTQQVQITSGEGTVTRSSVKDNPVGVYQGGSMSCILWSIFANDLHLHMPDTVRMVQFADDTQIWTTGKKQDLPQLISRIESALHGMFDWFCDHGMKVNADKTEFMIFGTRQMLRDFPGDVKVNFIGSKITCSNQARNLGVIFDRNLTFQPHVDHLVPKCTGILIALNQAKHVIPTGTLINLITALVFSTVRYCMSVYGTCNQAQIHRVQKLINFAARVLSGRRKYQHVSDVITNVGWLSARELCLYHRITTVHRVVTLQLPAPLARTIGQPAGQRHQHQTRGADRLTVPRISTEAGRRRLCYSGVTAYNDVLTSQGAVSIGKVKAHLYGAR